ncbi:RNA polymerase subunit sigma-70 [Staphylococcus edaphicus]|uniref:RNA polymerase subunit sigma-70 n=1 Tax=Staphylococcus edaphicus TaxID=1955013 RepID=A0A2C6WK91_9STAP|nr:RNA polymerase subunit sigma-70 [Staphylococcus edaphicus]PHK48789.1 RNA polymerase subunit sigma-70 [Staphylococcus edaphicus]UQW81393.1 sigma-70 family RNA polymerase sigma factor [Staphylococcus edaphicus]
MKQFNKREIKAFLMEYQETNDKNIIMEETNIDNFFHVQGDEDTEIESVDDTIYFNELETLIETVASDKEYSIFWLISEGHSYKKVGELFGVTEGRIRQIFDELLEKLP